MTELQNPTQAPQIDLLWVLAHPDDESFGNAGTMLLARDAGFSTGLICATRGEAGQIRDAALATRESLPAVREQELNRAMRLTGLTTLRLLGFRDSGMAGTAENDDPRAFINVPMDEAVAHVAAQIRELRPRAVIGFGPDGVYGHPDHIRIGAVTDAAVLLAAEDRDPGLGAPWKTEAYYHVTAPRERIVLSATNPESPFFGMSEEALATFGTPEDEITHWVDVSGKHIEKHAVLMQHATQISRDNPMSDINSPVAKSMLSVEPYKRVPLPWEDGKKPKDPLTQIYQEFPADVDQKTATSAS